MSLLYVHFLVHVFLVGIFVVHCKWNLPYNFNFHFWCMLGIPLLFPKPTKLRQFVIPRPPSGGRVPDMFFRSLKHNINVRRIQRHISADPIRDSVQLIHKRSARPPIFVNSINNIIATAKLLFEPKHRLDFRSKLLLATPNSSRQFEFISQLESTFISTTLWLC